MPNFKIDENELNTRLDKWLYFVKHLEDFQSIPEILKDEVFNQAFEKAELANLAPSDLDKYESSLKIYRDLKGVIDTAFDEGKIETAKSLKKLGVLIELIIRATGLTKGEI